MANPIKQLYLKIYTEGTDNLKKTNKDVNTFSKEAEKATKSSQKLNSVFKGLLGFDLFQRALSGVKSFIGGIISATAEMEQLTISFSTMLGSSTKAKQLLEDVRVAANTSSFEYRELLKTTKLYLAMGVKQKDVVKYLQMTGDVAAGLGVPLGRIALVMGQVRSKGKLMGDDLKQFTEAGVPLLDELASKYGKTAGEIREMVSAGKIGFGDVLGVFESLTSEGGRFYELQLKQSKSLAGLWSILKDVIFQTSAAVGKTLLKSMKSATKFMIKTLVGIQSFVAKNQAFFESFGDAMGEIFAGIGNVILGVGRALAPLFLILIKSLTMILTIIGRIMQSPVVSWLVTLTVGFYAFNFAIGKTVKLLNLLSIKTFKNYLAMLKKTQLYTKLATAAQWLMNTALWASPITWIIMGITAFILILANLIKHFSSVKDYLSDTTWGKAVLSVFEAIGDAIQWVVKKIQDALAWIADSAVGKAVKSAWDWVIGAKEETETIDKTTTEEETGPEAVAKAKGKGDGDVVSSGIEKAEAKRLEMLEKNLKKIDELKGVYSDAYLQKDSKLYEDLLENQTRSEEELQNAKENHLQKMSALRDQFDSGEISKDEYMASLKNLQLEEAKIKEEEALMNRGEMLKRREELEMLYQEGQIGRNQYMDELENMRIEAQREALDVWYAEQLEKKVLNDEAKLELRTQYLAAKEELDTTSFDKIRKMTDKQLFWEINKLAGAKKVEKATYDSFYTDVLGKSQAFGKAQAAFQKGQSIFNAMVASHEMAVMAYSAMAGIPIVGPALGVAAAAAAIAFGLDAVNSIRSQEASFAVGSPNLEQDYSGATVHKGEMIVPKTFAQGVRDGDIAIGDLSKMGNNTGNGGQTITTVVENNFDGATFTGKQDEETIRDIFEVAGKEMAEGRLSPLPTGSLTR